MHSYAVWRPFQKIVMEGDPLNLKETICCKNAYRSATFITNTVVSELGDIFAKARPTANVLQYLKLEIVIDLIIDLLQGDKMLINTMIYQSMCKVGSSISPSTPVNLDQSSENRLLMYSPILTSFPSFKNI